ncbi:hypothetical protein LK09_07670 [Microbacterium mangrovi]|uniref:Major facilitator superfamily (MFS) profile domain-containing protein n=1 Tax=Microbacterium mangrovi TaxID=1348253 RepID=A0A0B2A5N3_9MICO|nr:hypothetical protein LK09_07670 [Microbacterium mangrovi]
MRAVFVQGSAFAWGLQFAFLNTALALLLSTLLGASNAEIGLALALYNASGFAAAILIPMLADRRGSYLGWMLVCGVLTLATAALLAFSTSLALAILGLVVLGGPAAVGSSLFFAYLRAVGTGHRAVMNTRAMVSFAWVAGPPAAMLLAGWLGIRSVLLAIVVIALAGLGTVIGLRHSSETPSRREATGDTPSTATFSRGRVIAIVAAFVLLQATNATTTSAMTLYVVDSLHAPALWGGIALGVAALAEIPALMLLGRLSDQFGQIPLLLSGVAVGVIYFLLMTIVRDPIALVAAQLLNACFFAAVAGIGLTLFLDIIPKPGLASGLFTNTRRVGAIVSGGIFALASASAGFSAVFLFCAGLTAIALAVTFLAARTRPYDPHVRDRRRGR